MIKAGKPPCGSPGQGLLSLLGGFGSQGVGLELRASGFKPCRCPRISVGHQGSPLMQPGRETFLLEVSASTAPGSRALEHPRAYFRRHVA